MGEWRGNRHDQRGQSENKMEMWGKLEEERREKDFIIVSQYSCN
jgi:hypothetical protein